MTNVRYQILVAVTAFAVTLVSLVPLATSAHATVVKRQRPVGYERIVRPALPGPVHLVNGGVLVPRSLAVVPTLDDDYFGDIENPNDDLGALPQDLRGMAPNAAALVGANARANNTAGDPAGTTNSENAIAMLGNYGVTGWNDGKNFSTTPGASGYATTTDGGATWTDGGVPPAVSPARYEGDPSLTVDNAGNFYYANLYTPDGGTTSAISVNRGFFTGLVFSWTNPVMPQSTTTDFLDKEWIAVDPVGGNVYLTYTRFLAAGGNQIEFTRSTDQGLTWSAPIVLSNPGGESCQGSRVAVGPSGEIQTIYFVYDNASQNNYMRARRSTDGGLTFGPEVTLPSGPSGLLSNYGSGSAGFNRARGIGFPSLAIDRSGGVNNGRSYATWEETFNYYYDPLGTLGNVAEVEANDTPGTANPITIGQSVSGSMSSTADQDWFSFAGVAGQKVIIYLTPGSGDGFLRLFAGGGAAANRAMLSYIGFGTGLVVYTCPSTQTYYFRVLANSATVGTYTVYTGVDSPDPGDEIAIDTRDVIFQSSPDGVTWTPSSIVNDDAKVLDNEWPEVAVDACGAVYVDWMDHRNDPVNGILSDVYYSSSNNAGVSWNPSIKVNDGPSVNWSLVSSNLAPNMGDYWNLVPDRATGATIYANFADGRQGTPDSWVAPITECSITATEIALVSTRTDAGQVVLNWYSSEGASLTASVERRVPSGEWSSLGTIHGNGDGTLTFVDRAVSAGNTYEYRLAVGTQYYGQTTVVIPSNAKFALERVSRNPAQGDLQISYSLPTSAPAKIELLDVTGRSVRTMSVGGRSGTDVARLASKGELASGLYIVKLTQGANRTTMKVTVAGQ